MSEPIDMDALEAEFKAMREVAGILEPLSPEQRRKVLSWAQQFAGPVLRGPGTGNAELKVR
jgi:hypothetical protein